MKDPNAKLEVNIGLAVIETLTMVNRNNIYLRSILKQQLEIKELINKTADSEIESNVNAKFEKLTSNISKICSDINDQSLSSVLK